MTSERDREMAREWLGPEDDVGSLADLLASVRREGHAEALAAVRKIAKPAGAGWCVDEAERALAAKEQGR